MPPHIHRYVSKPCLPLQNAQSQYTVNYTNSCKPHQAHKSFYIFIYGLGILFHTLSYVKERKYIYLHIYTPVRDIDVRNTTCMYLHQRAPKLRIELKSSIASKYSNMSECMESIALDMID
jgi:hypothetical protein